MILLQIYYTKEGVKMKNKQINRTLSLLLSVVMVLSLCPLIAKAEGTKPNIKIGDYIKLGTYENEPILWRCVDIDDNGPLMLMDKVLGSMPYDAKTSENSATRSHSRNSFRSSYGSNHWRDSNMRSWLNSDADAGKVDWLCGNPPKSDYVGYGSEYDKKAGFLNGFSKAEIAAIKTVTQRSIVSHPEYSAGYIAGPGADLPYNTDIASVAYGFEKAYYENIIDKVFLPDVKQLNTIYNNSNILENYYLAKNKDGIRWSYWLRTPITDCNHDMRYVETDGNIYRVAPYFGHIGVRPAFYLDTDYYIVSEGNGEVNSPYVGDAADKPGDDISISGPDEEGGDGDWDIDTDQSIQLNLGPWYSSDGEYANSTIPVQVIQKTRSDLENMVIVICGEGYTKDQQQKFINDVKRIWAGVLKHEPYRSMADRFNVYALCTASKTSGFASENTFFDITMSTTSRSPMISLYKSVLKNQILTRCIGPAFIEKIHDAHIKEKTNPNEITIGDEYAPYYYVNEYISQFVVLVNSGQYGGASMNNLDVGLHYVTATVDNIQSEYTLAHELGHGLLHLGDEYNAYGGAYTMPEQQDKQSLNIAGLRESPITIKWKDMLGFRKTYTCRDSNTSNSSNMVNSSWQCMMRTQNQELCDVCQLQGFKVMSQLIKDTDDIYIAIPEVKLYTGNYKNPFEDYSAYTEAEYYGYLAYASDRAQRLLSGTSKNKFTKDMKGQEVELRTIAQNLSGIEEQEITLQLWVEHEDGTRAVTENGEEILKEQTFTVPVWDEKENFYIKGMRNYSGTEFDSGLMNCSLIYKIPENADLKDGDTIKFSVIDKMGKTLADDNTETQNYANVTISYQLEDSNAVPNTQTAVIPVPIGTKMDIEPPEELYGYKFVKAEGLGKIVGDDGLNIICYYEDPSGKLPVEYKVEYDWGTDYPTDTTLPTDNTKYDSIENAKEAVKNQKYDENSTSTVKKNDKDGTWTFSGWTATVEGTTVKFTGAWTFTATPIITYTVTYDWGTDFPTGEMLPVDSKTYKSEEEAKAAMDGKYTSLSTSTAEKDGKSGTWKFSGWIATLIGTTVKFNGMWTFTPDAPVVDADTPTNIKLVSDEYKIGDKATALDGKATVSDNGVLSYQWYKSDKADNFNGTAIDGQNGETFVPDTSKEGTYYYYVIATNTKADATGKKTASVTSSMAIINVKEFVKYTVVYDWGSDYPTDVTVPKDDTKYENIEKAKEAVKNQKYDENSTSTAEKNSKSGKWSFSGWTTAVEGTTVKFTGVWTFTENAIPVVTRKPSSGGSGGSGSSTYNIKVSPEITNGFLSVNPSRASNGKKVSVIVKPNNGYVLNSVIVKDSNDKEIAVTKQSDGTYTFIMPSSNVTVSAKFDTEIAKDVVTEIEKSIEFKDVKKGDWYFDAVQWAVKNNITEGSGEDTFSPDVICTRTQMVTFLWRVAGSPEPKITKCDFSDVDNSAYYYKAVLWAVEKGVTVGTSDTTFSPNENVTRGQTVAFLYREAGSPFETGEDVFNDVNSNGYYFKAVSWATKNGITVGTGNGKFEPDMDCNRAQIVAMLYRTQR